MTNSLISTSSPTARPAQVFDAAFYTTVFLDLVRKECRRQADKVPVVEFRLGDGGGLDVCHILQLSDRWLAVAFFRDPEACDDMDVAFLPYELVVRITVSLHNPQSRRLGFTVTEPAKVATTDPDKTDSPEESTTT